MTERERRLFTGCRDALRTLENLVRNQVLDPDHPVLRELEHLVAEFKPEGQPTRVELAALPVAPDATVEAD
jgi:hypothetical protein